MLLALTAVTVQTSVGFGSGLIFVPAATLVVGPGPAVAMMLVGIPAVAAVLYVMDRPRTPLLDAAPAAAVSLLTVPIGVWLLTQSNEDVLRLLVGCTVLGAVIANRLSSGKEEVVRESNLPRLAAAGLVSGVMRGSTSMGGPALVLYYHWMGGGAARFRSRMFSYGALSGIPSIGIAAAAGVFDDKTVPVVLWGLLGAALGVALGIRLRPFVTDARLRRLSMLLLAATSLLAIATAGSALL
ncbi:MAG: sulfite exporter TauE/SafE family protein [Chloroflexi bacterium]|nr:sulfite exporter TauE/SafE family protein [Chloroflexota bacterium]MDA1147713.1 sulfite exporter TauE/SafE family protein [Chloroflexota bacterium]